VDEPRRAVPPPLGKLMNLFRSLGDNCEFGLVQREAGAEPIDLLRFAGLHIPIERRLRAVTEAIVKGFEGLGQPGTVHCHLGDPDAHGNREFFVYDSIYQLRYHTAQHEGAIEPDRVLRQQVTALQFWRLKFLNELRTADKVCVWKSNQPQHEVDVRRLLAALRDYGPNHLLWVAQCDARHADGTVDDLGEGLFKGYISQFAAYENAGNIMLGSWVAMCARLYQLMPTLGGADRHQTDRQPGEASSYAGSVDGVLADRVCGWCWRSGNPDPVLLELRIDGQYVATFVANDPRDDLKRAGIGDGKHGFFSPVVFQDVSPDAVINVAVVGTDIEVPGSGRALSEYRRL
jgi:hypothetical protein